MENFKIILKSVIPLIEEKATFRVVITEMYPRITWELVADPLGIAEHILGTANPDCTLYDCVPPILSSVTGSKLFKPSLHLIFEALLAINRSLNFIRLRTSLKTISQ